MNKHYYCEKYSRYVNKGLSVHELVSRDGKVIAFGGRFRNGVGNIKIDTSALVHNALVTYYDPDTYDSWGGDRIDFSFVYSTDEDLSPWGHNTTKQIGAIHYALQGPILWVDLNEVTLDPYWLILDNRNEMCGLNCTEEEPKDFRTMNYYRYCKLVRCYPKVVDGKLKIDYDVVVNRLAEDSDYNEIEQRSDFEKMYEKLGSK